MSDERFEIDIDASPAEIWDRLTTSDGLASWFGTSATIECRVGGERVVRWGGVEEMVARVSEVEPERRLRLAYLADGEELGAEEWLISTAGSTTRLTLVTSMPPTDTDDWEGFVGDIRRGWRLFMASMRFSLERADHPDRLAECRHLPAPVRPEVIWTALASFLARSEHVDGLEPELLIEPHSWLLATADRSLLLDVEGAGEERVLYAQAATHGGPDAWRNAVLDAVARTVAETTPSR